MFIDHPRGESYQQLLHQLSNDWLESGPPVCFVEGFPGVGKETLTRDLAKAHQDSAVSVWMPESESTRLNDLLLRLGTGLSVIGRNEVADAVDRGQSQILALESVLLDRVLVIVLGFDRVFSGSDREPGADLRQLLYRLANRPRAKGRVLLVSDEYVPRSRWTESFPIHTLHPPSVEEAVLFLDMLLRQMHRQAEVPNDRRADVVKWLGRNPRAMRVFVGSLVSSELNELIGLAPEAWEAREREVSAALLQELERELLANTMERLPADAAVVLRQAAVYRNPVRKEAIDPFAPTPQLAPSLRSTLVRHFLMEHHQGFYALHPIVREIELAKLRATPTLLRQAHRNAGSYYTRHFTAQQVAGPSGRLGSFFVEARFHLVQAGRGDDLSAISSRFSLHLEKFGFGNRLPENLNEREEQIAVLSALLVEPGGKELHYHLARLLHARGRPGDNERALQHAEHACGPQSRPEAWVLRIRLAKYLHGVDAALATTRDGIQQIPEEQNLYALYQVCSKLLASAGRVDEAIELLREGIGRIPEDFALYQTLAELLAPIGRVDEAIQILNEGIRRIPADRSLVALYQARAKLLASLGRAEEAIQLLYEGIDRIPAEKGLFALYQVCGELLATLGRTDEAIEFLRAGIDRISANKGVVALYRACATLLMTTGRSNEGIQLLRAGIHRVSVDKGIDALYQACAEALASTGQTNEATQLLRQGIERIPLDKGVETLYQVCGGLLLTSARPDEAIQLLREGIRRCPEKALVPLYQALGNAYLHAGMIDAAASATIEAMRRAPLQNNRQHLIITALYLCRAAGQSDLLRSILKELNPQEDREAGLGELLLLQMDRDWSEAGKRAQKLALQFPSFLDFRMQGAFALLAAHEFDSIAEFIKAFPDKLKLKHNPLTWLLALLKVHQRKFEEAATSLRAYTGDVITTDASQLLQYLLRIWNGQERDDPASLLPYYFPCLPTTVSGLSTSVCRHPFGPPADFEKPTALAMSLKQGARTRLTFLSVATEWSSHHGGLSTFNRGLCMALAAAGHRVFCHLPAEITELNNERHAAASVGVELVTSPPTPGVDETARLFLRPTLPDDAVPDVVIAHDRITGPAGLALVRHNFPGALRIHVVHTASGEIEPHKFRETGASRRAEEREKLQRELASSASIVAAVGPRLAREARDLLLSHTVPVVELVPGLPPGRDTRLIPEGLRCLILGRAEDEEVKGVDIAARALSILEQEHGSEYLLRPKLVVRGAAPGTGDDLRNRLRQFGGSHPLDVDVREYTADEEDLVLDILRSSVVLMPSRAEGFGLVGLEAIALNTPVLISGRSGLGEFLSARIPAWAPGCVVPVKDDAETDARIWAIEIHRILRQREEAFRQARAVREAIAGELRWEDTAQLLIGSVQELRSAK